MVENQIKNTKPAVPEEFKEMDKKVVPPDGGWGWMVVLGTALTNVFNQSLLATFGLLYGDEIEKLGHGTQGAALVLSSMLFVQNFCGPISASAINLTSPRTVALIGVAFSGFGCILSGYSTALWHLIVTYGLMVGLGLGLIQSGTFVSINSYFKAKRGRAVGFSVVGTGVGQMIMPHVVRYLLANYTFADTTLVMGGLCFQGFIGCSLIQPVEWHQKRDINETNETRQLLENKKVRVRKTSNTTVSASNNNIAIEPAKEPQVHVANETLAAKIKRVLDVGLLTDIRFLILIIGCAITVVSTNNFSLIFPFFLQESVFLTKQQTATCMSFVAGSDIIGRLTLPTIADHFKVPARVSFLSTALYLMVIRQILAFQSSYTILLVTSALYGCGRSMIIVTNNIAVIENYPQERVPAALGLGMLMKGVLVMPLNLFLGWVRDYTGSFIICMTAQNVLIVLLAAMWIPDIIYLRYIKRKQHNKNIDIKL